MKWVALGDLVALTSGGTPDRSRKEYYEGDIPWITGADIDPAGGISARAFITEEAVSKSATTVAQTGWLLLVTRTSVGKVGVVERPTAFSQDVTGIAPDTRQIDVRYLLHFLRTTEARLLSHARGATIKGVTRAVVAELPVPLPPLDEQRRIAAILDQADANRSARRNVLNKLDDLGKAIFADMFGTRRAKARGWASTTLGSLIAAGPQNGIYKPASQYGDGTPIVRIDSFQGGTPIDVDRLRRLRITHAESRLYGLESGDMLINRVNARTHLGKATLVSGLKETTVFESNMMRFRVDTQKVLPEYVLAFLGTSDGKRQIQRAAKDAVNQSSINQKDVSDLELLVPALEDQERFLRRSVLIEEQRARGLESLVAMQGLIASIQFQAFAGRL